MCGGGVLCVCMCVCMHVCVYVFVSVFESHMSLSDTWAPTSIATPIVASPKSQGRRINLSVEEVREKDPISSTSYHT